MDSDTPVFGFKNNKDDSIILEQCTPHGVNCCPKRKHYHGSLTRSWIRGSWTAGGERCRRIGGKQDCAGWRRERPKPEAESGHIIVLLRIVEQWQSHFEVRNGSRKLATLTVAERGPLPLPEWSRPSPSPAPPATRSAYPASGLSPSTAPMLASGLDQVR